MKIRPIIIVSLLISSLLITACQPQKAYVRFQSLPAIGWHQDSLITFQFEIQDTCAYNIYIHARHTERYPYQNMWLFVQRPTFVDTTTVPMTKLVDTLEFYLADDRGQWLGYGKNGIIHMPIIYEEHYHFSKPGTYEMTLEQGMRCEELVGVKDMGIEIRKAPLYGEK